MKLSPPSWLERFPALGDISASERDALVAKSRTVEFSPGDRLYEAGARPGHYVLVLSGSVRVHQLTADGREIVFYRLTQGDTCVMTASALLRRMSYAAYAVAEGPVAVVLIFTLLYFTYHNLIDSLRVFTCVPFGWVGGIFALWLRDMPFSISAAIGFIALSGVAVLDDMILVSYVRQLRAKGLPLDEAVKLLAREAAAPDLARVGA